MTHFRDKMAGFKAKSFALRRVEQFRSCIVSGDVIGFDAELAKAVDVQAAIRAAASIDLYPFARIPRSSSDADLRSWLESVVVAVSLPEHAAVAIGVSPEFGWLKVRVRDWSETLFCILRCRELGETLLLDVARMKLIAVLVNEYQYDACEIDAVRAASTSPS